MCCYLSSSCEERLPAAGPGAMEGPGDCGRRDGEHQTRNPARRAVSLQRGLGRRARLSLPAVPL